MTRLAFWVGAGISIPSHMPGGEALTMRWLRHLLPADEPDILLALFDRVAPIVGKRLPRLEQVIDDAVTVFGPGCLSLLRFFETCVPNGIHRAIAREVSERHGLVFTTNFDTAIEQAGGRLEVMTPSSGRFLDHGIVKLHGSVDEPLERLGHSIRNLQGGLSPQITTLLDETLEGEDVTVIFLGYSGSDFLDVTPYFMERQSAQTKASAVWVAYAAVPCGEVAEEDWEDEIGGGAVRMLGAFETDRVRVLKGTVESALAGFGVTVDTSPLPAGVAWDAAWDSVFVPSDADKVLYAARVYATLGHASRCLDLLRSFSPPAGAAVRAADLQELALRTAGLHRAAQALHRRFGAATPASRELIERRRLVALVSNGHPWRGLWQYAKAVRQIRAMRAESAKGQDVSSAAWLVIEAGQCTVEQGRELEARVSASGLGMLSRLAARFLVGLCLEAFQQLREHDPHACGHPHLVAGRHRLSEYLSNFPGRVISWFEDRVLFARTGLPIFHVVDITGSSYLESDSLVGYLANERDSAELWLEGVRYDFEAGDASRATAVSEAEDRIRSSLAIARLLGNLDGQRACLKARLRNPELRGKRALAQRRGRILARIERQLLMKDEALSRQIEAWC